ncbi:uncharacterized protein LOC128952144 [Oppia nitens]|uniref:uncharacterized protein LOC128952144 n=1 Tax=Oppia nitens TaxID=1686743 RepID=UPI0023DB20FE|nr:uncharacterized protein LOC128952144 [Oppia nitens]
MIIVVIVVISLVVITAFILIKNRKMTKRKSKRPGAAIEASCESVVAISRPLNSIVNSGRPMNINSMSEESMVLQQSDFSPQVVNAVIENDNKIRESLISDNEVPPSYDEASHLPSLSS